jgi:hypothetical protein
LEGGRRRKGERRTNDSKDDGLGVDDLTNLGRDLTFDGIAFLLPVGGAVDLWEDVLFDVLRYQKEQNERSSGRRQPRFSRATLVRV